MSHSLSEKMKQVEMIKNAGGIQCLLNKAYEILGNPMVIFDMDNKLVSNTDNVSTDDFIWNEITGNGSFSSKTQEFFKEEGFIDAVANAGTITFLLSDKLKYDRMLGKVFNKNNAHVANLEIVACHRKFEAEDPAIFEAICKIVSAEIGSSDFFQNYGKEYEESLIKKLIEENIPDREVFSAQLSSLYNGLEENLFLAVIDTNKHDHECAELGQLRDILMQAQPLFKYSIYDNVLVVIISSSNNALDIKKDLNRMERILKQKNVYAGISRRFENLFELPKYYNEAVGVLKMGLISRGYQRIFQHSENIQDA